MSNMTTTANLRLYRRPDAATVQRRAQQITRGAFTAYVRELRP